MPFFKAGGRSSTRGWALGTFVSFTLPEAARILWSVKQIADATTLEAVAAPFLTRSDVSKLLGVSPNTVTRWAREGRLACQVTLGGHHRFERELVEQLRKSLYRAGGRPA